MHLLPELKQRGSTTHPQNTRKRKIINPYIIILLQSTFKQVQSLLVETHLRISVYHTAPGDDVFVRHFVEHLAREVDVAAFSVRVDEGASDEDVVVVGGFEGEGVEGEGEGEGGEGSDGLGGGGECVIVGEEAVAEHAAEEAESREGEVVLGEGGDDGAPCGGGFVGKRIEEFERRVREVGFGVEVDQVVAHQWNGFEP